MKLKRNKETCDNVNSELTQKIEVQDADIERLKVQIESLENDVDIFKLWMSLKKMFQL